MKSICFYSAQYIYTGGIENVVRRLHDIFKAHDIRLWTACEHGQADWITSEDNLVLGDFGAARQQKWLAALKERETEVVVFNHVGEDKFEQICQDMAYLRRAGIRCVLVCHSSFLMPFYDPGEEDYCFNTVTLAKNCDLVLSVSKYEVYWWRGIGLRALYIRNPFNLPKPLARTSTANADRINVLWVGRFDSPKNPLAAIAVLKKAIEKCPRIHLTMVGPNKSGCTALAREATRLDVLSNITILEERPSVAGLWVSADINLITSYHETFCLVLAEAKSYGMPTVMFELPFLELAEKREGLLTAPQDDVEGLAVQLASVANDEALRKKLGDEAKASLANFTDEAVWQSWVGAFEALEKHEAGYDVPIEARAIASSIYRGWAAYRKRTKWIVEMDEDWTKATHTTLRPLASVLSFIRNARRKLLWR